MSASEIIEQIKILPKKELAHVIEFVHQIERQVGAASPEMTEAELLKAAKHTGSFTLLEGPGEDIYSAGSLDQLYAILSERYESDEHDVAARHNEHQP